MVRRWIMHVDMDAFYASVEQRDNPELRGRPVIVGGTSDRGVVATASYEARAYGVHSALGTKKARQLCPDGIFLPPRIAYYRTISRQIRKIFEGYSPYIEPLSLDEAFLDISGLYGYYKDVLEVGRAVKKDIKEQTGLVASAGIGPNKFLAKLASDLDKPDGLVCIPYGKEEELLAPLPIDTDDSDLVSVVKSLYRIFKVIVRPINPCLRKRCATSSAKRRNCRSTSSCKTKSFSYVCSLPIDFTC